MMCQRMHWSSETFRESLWTWFPVRIKISTSELGSFEWLKKPGVKTSLYVNGKFWKRATLLSRDFPSRWMPPLPKEAKTLRQNSPSCVQWLTPVIPTLGEERQARERDAQSNLQLHRKSKVGQGFTRSCSKTNNKQPKPKQNQKNLCQKIKQNIKPLLKKILKKLKIVLFLNISKTQVRSYYLS